MRPSSTAERTSVIRAAARGPVAARLPLAGPHGTVRISLWVSVTVVTVLFGYGAWQRRWIADDGLIVLRTVRNLLAGNGPVFNAGERVEANTSTVWTYLIYVGSLIGGPVRLEYIALVLALALSLLGMVFAMLGAARLYGPGVQGRRALLLPAGALVYIAIPPARDFATSGLENGLVLSYLGLLWWLMVRWSQLLRAPDTAVRATAPDPAENAVTTRFTAVLAFVAGLSVLVRPELALVGGLALLMVLVAARGRRRRLLVVAAGGALPVPYQIFRMGYYALPVPNTALAKDASGAKWEQGLRYLANFDDPYLLWAPGILLGGLAVLLFVSGSRPWWIRRTVPPGYSRAARIVQSPAAVVAFMVVSGLLQAAYWIRQGGDFMHGRVLLTPVFLLLAPVAVIPVLLPDGVRMSRGAGYLLTGAVAVVWLGIVGWALWAATSPGMGRDATKVTYSGIVDERRFYAQATGHAHPLTAADYLDYPRMRAALEAIENTPDGALLLPAGNYDQWDVVPAIPDPQRPDGQPGPHTLFFTNLGMSSMNVGLEVRVIDQIGLANPIAAHTARLEDGRIGHDKNLFPDWAIAEGPFLPERPFVPPYIDEDWIAQAKVALTCPETDAMLNSIRGELTPRRFVSNLVHALDFYGYRIDRVPAYELRRCGLAAPPPKAPPYTGLPATGP